MREAGAHPVLLYDGVCGLCNRTVQFVLKRDRGDTFRFASLQSDVARGILAHYAASPSDLDTFYVVTECEAELAAAVPQKSALLARSDAAIFVLRELGGIWRVASGLLRMLPRPVRDCGYNLVARRRYRMFGRYDACPIPSAGTRNRFLDL